MLGDILYGTKYLGNQVIDYISFLAIILIGIIVVIVIKRIVFKTIKKWTEKTKSNLDDFVLEQIDKAFNILAYYGVFYLAVASLALPEHIGKIIDVVGVIILTIVGIRFISALIIYFIHDYFIKGEDEARAKSLKGVNPAVRTIIWGLGIFFLLDNLGIKISTVIAGLGIGGIAVALAAQAILRDLFSYFIILFDQPFEIGDFVIVGDFLGEIEKIGLKSTKIRSLSGEELIFSNTDLTDARIKNYKRMERRRVLFKLGLTYDTSAEKLKQAVAIVTAIIEKQECITFDRCHFLTFDNFSLGIEAVYYVLDRDYLVYANIQQAINLAIREEFEAANLEFAYPTQTLYVNQDTSS